MAKKIFISEAIPTPKFFEAKSVDALQDTDHLRFPLFVKPRLEGSSKGLTEKSRVTNIEELKNQVALITNMYNQPALIEEFISGQEFTVAVIGNRPAEAMPVVQVKIDGKLELGDEFYTFSRISSDRLEYVCPAPISEDLKKKISQYALAAYEAVDCLDFGRVDFRVDNQGNPYVLEVNPLPCLSIEDIFPLIAKHIGITYEEIIGRIIKSALKRYSEAHT